jgi:hypothetical protein
MKRSFTVDAKSVRTARTTAHRTLSIDQRWALAARSRARQNVRHGFLQ